MILKIALSNNNPASTARPREQQKINSGVTGHNTCHAYVSEGEESNIFHLYNSNSNADSLYKFISTIQIPKQLFLANSLKEKIAAEEGNKKDCAVEVYYRQDNR